MNNLKEIRKKAGLSQADVAACLNVSRQTYSHYETGKRRISSEILLKLSEIFNVPIDNIVRSSKRNTSGGTVFTFDTDTSDRLGKNNIDSASSIPAQPKSVKIPIYSSISSEKLDPKLDCKAVTLIGWEEISENMTREGKDYFALKVKDDTMYPEYMPGDIVIILKQHWCDLVEDCVVCARDYEGVLATVRLNADGGMTLTTKNPRYPPQTFTKEQVSNYPVKIMGVVVEIRRKIKPVSGQKTLKISKI